MERYTKEKRVIIVKNLLQNLLQKLNLALLLGHPLFVPQQHTGGWKHNLKMLMFCWPCISV